jgi:protein phosphatase PTC6
VSDGISSVLSDQEVVDIARLAPNPKAAATSILAFAEELGSDDNATAIVVPLAGWGKIRGPDKTKALREYRRQQAGLCLLPVMLFALSESKTAVGSERQRRM